MSSSSQTTATLILVVFIFLALFGINRQLERISENTGVLKGARVEQREPICSAPALS